MMSMRLKWGQVWEEVGYSAKQMGLNVIWIPWITAVLYWIVSWSPISSGAVVGTSSIALSIMVSLLFSGAVSREKLLGIHEMLLTLPLSPVHLLLLKTLGGFIIGITGMAVGSFIGVVLADYTGTPVPPITALLGVIISAPALFTITLLVILITLLFQSKYLDITKIALLFTAYFAPMYIPKYFGVGISMGIALVLSLLLSAGALIVSFLIIHSLEERLGEKMVLV